jgi:hypothetical protein
VSAADFREDAGAVAPRHAVAHKGAILDRRLHFERERLLERALVVAGAVHREPIDPHAQIDIAHVDLAFLERAPAGLRQRATRTDRARRPIAPHALGHDVLAALRRVGFDGLHP